MCLIYLLQVSSPVTTWTGYGWETSSTALIQPTRGYTSLTVICRANNTVLNSQVLDSMQVPLHCKIVINNTPDITRLVFTVAPAEVVLSGPSRVLSGSTVSLECVTAPSTPAASITWSVTQAGERLQYSPSQDVEQLEDGSFVSRSWLEVMATKGHDLVAECYATNQVMDNDFVAYAHVIEILSK